MALYTWPIFQPLGTTSYYSVNYQVLTDWQANFVAQDNQIQSIAAGSGITDGAITTAKIQDSAITPPKLQYDGTLTDGDVLVYRDSFGGFVSEDGGDLANYPTYSAVVTYDYPDIVVGSDGQEYRCVGTSVLGDDPVTSVTGNWVYKSGSSTRPIEIEDADFNAIYEITYAVDTTTDEVEATLPASPADGQSVYFIDHLGIWDVNKITIMRNGKTIMGLSENMDIDTVNASVKLTFFADEDDWRLNA